MESRNFVDEFNITSNIDENMDVTDYERFENKELLDLGRIYYFLIWILKIK